ncbi:hypothetical protein ILYODFUR_033711 [Ilyodon furcidens]|uniref:Uncharacterized protein n=1 Tax=Ilyodon furcidens TaxID=33524 RepID=A0ABV0V039_9TELE
MLCAEAVPGNQQGDKSDVGKTKRALTYDSITSHTVSESPTIVHIARQLYTHSRNVSVLCFSVHKGSSLLLSLQTDPLDTTNGEETFSLLEWIQLNKKENWVTVKSRKSSEAVIK